MIGSCQFALCSREAELEVVVGAGVEPVLVCGLHVTPVLTWGVADPVREPVIRPVIDQHGQVA